MQLTVPEALNRCKLNSAVIWVLRPLNASCTVLIYAGTNFGYMDKEWVKGKAGENIKFKRETLLNYATNRWALNKAASVDGVSALIRNCSPKNVVEWEKYYFENARQKKKAGCNLYLGTEFL